MGAIDWGEELRKALAVQDLDRQIQACQDERHLLLNDATAAHLERDAKSAKSQLAGLEAAIAEAARKQRLAEIERRAAEAERERNAQRLASGAVRSARDIEGMQKNIAGSAARASDLETRILELMEETDALNARAGQVRDHLQSATAALSRRREASRERLRKLDGEMPMLTAKRAAAAQRVDAAALREYERVRVRADGVGIAPVDAAACGVCGLELSALILAIVRRGERIACEQCGRLLVETRA